MAERVRAISGHEIAERPPIQVEVGDQVTVGSRDTTWPAFVFVTAESGEGWVPSRYLSADSGPAEVTHPYDTTELPTSAGEMLDVLVRDDESGWLWCRAASGAEGWVPISTLAAAG
jgi:hypothetical protein